MRNTARSLPGIGWLDRITVSSAPVVTSECAPPAICDSAAPGSPWLPVQTMQTSSVLKRSSCSTPNSARSGTSSTPSWRAMRTLFTIERPTGTTTRPSDMAASQICWTRCRWLAKQLTISRRSGRSLNSRRSVAPISVSDALRPGRSALVESAISRAMPSSPSPRRRSRSVSRPSTGEGSILKSPVCTSAPTGVCSTMHRLWGTEWVIGSASTSNGPILRRSPSPMTWNDVRSAKRASVTLCSASAIDRADPYRGTSMLRRKWGTPPRWSSWPWVTTSPTMSRARELSQPMSGSTCWTPGMIAGSGNITPKSMTRSLPLCSTTVQLRPTSPSPPRNVTVTLPLSPPPLALCAGACRVRRARLLRCDRARSLRPSDPAGGPSAGERRLRRLKSASDGRRPLGRGPPDRRASGPWAGATRRPAVPACAAWPWWALDWVPRRRSRSRSSPAERR